LKSINVSWYNLTKQIYLDYIMLSLVILFITQFISRNDISRLYEGYRPPGLVWECDLVPINPCDSRRTMTGLKEFSEPNNDIQLMQRIRHIHKVDSTIKILTSSNVSIDDKIKLINMESQSVKKIDILSGGLMDDWEYDIYW
jgi:hypothetical protein